MSQLEPAIDRFPNKLGRIILLAMEEVLGKNDIQAVMGLLGRLTISAAIRPMTWNCRLNSVIWGAASRFRGALRTVGWHGFVAYASVGLPLNNGLREFGAELGLTDLAFRTLPLDQRLEAGLLSFAGILNRFSPGRVRVEQTGAPLYWLIHRCPVCWGREANQPVCHLAVGVLQEMLSWLSGGKHYIVVESLCAAAGDPSCTIVIARQPVE